MACATLIPIPPDRKCAVEYRTHVPGSETMMPEFFLVVIIEQEVDHGNRRH
jgi:hypothetical protein